MCISLGILRKPFIFPKNPDILQVTIYRSKPLPRGAGAWETPQESVSKVGSHGIGRPGWPGSLPEERIPGPASQPEGAHTHTLPPPPPGGGAP